MADWLMEYGDHPRSRGVYGTSTRRNPLKLGSSPLARGLREERCIGEEATRIIPARAGFTLGDPGPGRLLADHPRSRGVYIVGALCRQGLWGSSPLARGLHLAEHGARHQPRIIPARAGFTR